MASRRRFDPVRLERSVGRRVSEIREEQGLTQAQFSVKLRCTPRYVAQIEAGRNVTLHTLARLAHVLDVAVIDLMTPPRSTKPRRRGRPSGRAPK